MALSPEVTSALATLRSRWGAAAPAPLGDGARRDGGEGLGVVGALATLPVPAPDPELERERRRDAGAIISTGFPALDAILGPGGLPRGMGLSLRGDLSSGRTTIALRLVAEAQAAGAIAAWLDLASALDPVEAVSRGVDLEWLVVVTPGSVDEGVAIAGALLSGRAVDLVVVDLPLHVDAPATVADRLARLAARARRAAVTLVVLEPPGLAPGVAQAVGEGTGIRLELARRSWIRLRRDVVGQLTEVVVARSRAGPPGKRATLRILYADGGERDACLRRDQILAPPPVDAPALPVPGNRNHATPPSPSSAPPPRSREATPPLRLVAGGAGDSRREAVVAGDGPRCRPRREGPRRPARDVARVGASPRSRGDVPRP